VAEASRLAVNANRSRPTILVVEDEAQVRHLACEFLTAAGYRVLSAQNGTEALELADRYAQSIQAVLTDVIMPKMRGPELALQLEKLLPHVKIIYMTGYLDDSCQSLNPQSVLNKPFSRETIVRHVDQALEAIRHVDPLAVAV
jgi:CheY-like chemotaxis protein